MWPQSLVHGLNTKFLHHNMAAHYENTSCVATQFDLPIHHYSKVTWILRHLKSLATCMYFQKFVQGYNKEKINDLHYWPFVRNPPVSGGFPTQRACIAEIISIDLYDIIHLCCNPADHPIISPPTLSWSLPIIYMGSYCVVSVSVIHGLIKKFYTYFHLQNMAEGYIIYFTYNDLGPGLLSKIHIEYRVS